MRQTSILAALGLVMLGCGSPSAPANVAPVTSATPRATAVDPPSPPSPSPSTAPAPSATPEPEADVRSANAFGWKIYGAVRKSPGNVMLSGTSLRSALAMAYLGAKGDTATEIATALGLDADPAKAALAARAETAAWQAARGQAELVVASRLFTDKERPLVPDFAKTVEDAFGAAPQSLDFQRAPEDARKTINAWVSEKTSDKIHELLAKGTVDARSRLVITNAIYFKARWSLPFAASETKDEPFKVDAKKSVTAKTMHATDSHRYAEGNGARVVELGYHGSELSMLLVLPDDPGALGKLEESMSDETIAKWTPSVRRVAISLPRFSFRSGGTMNGALRELGIKTAFGDRADFSGLSASGAKDVSVSQVAHQTWVAVDEQGTEAAAATGVVMRATSLVMGPIVELKFDHPFLFVIRDARRGRVLFVGRVADPTAKGS
jgi:serpin B